MPRKGKENIDYDKLEESLMKLNQQDKYYSIADLMKTFKVSKTTIMKLKSKIAIKHKYPNKYKCLGQITSKKLKSEKKALADDVGNAKDEKKEADSAPVQVKEEPGAKIIPNLPKKAVGRRITATNQLEYLIEYGE